MKKVKLNEQGTPNISSEITLSFENGSQSSQFGQILKSELYKRAKPIVQLSTLKMLWTNFFKLWYFHIQAPCKNKLKWIFLNVYSSVFNILLSRPESFIESTWIFITLHYITRDISALHNNQSIFEWMQFCQSN